jgi:hypothetical protein
MAYIVVGGGTTVLVIGCTFSVTYSATVLVIGSAVIVTCGPWEITIWVVLIITGVSVVRTGGLVLVTTGTSVDVRVRVTYVGIKTVLIGGWLKQPPNDVRKIIMNREPTAESLPIKLPLGLRCLLAVIQISVIVAGRTDHFFLNFRFIDRVQVVQ